MENINEILKEYYDSYKEDNRLVKDKSHQLEFITTIKYIDKYLKEGDRILDIGAGTGRYSLYYANKGYQVNAIELVESNLNELKKNITPNMNIDASLGNATNLSKYKDNTFDITLVLGPMYHLFSDSDQQKAINEAIRVTKSNGYIYIAYITNDSVILSYFLRKNHMKELSSSCDKNYHIINKEKEIFYVFLVEEFLKFMKKFNISLKHNLSTDGIAPSMRELINNLSDEDYEEYIKYHLTTCERKNLQGYANHMLYIGRKSKEKCFFLL